MQILIALDQLLNACFGGYSDETLSAKAYRKRHDSRAWMWAERIIDCIFFFQKKHCQQSFYAEIERKQLPVEYRR